MSNVISLAAYKQHDARGDDQPHTLGERVAELRRNTEAVRVAADDMGRAMSRLQQADIAGRARELRDAKLASL